VRIQSFDRFIRPFYCNNRQKSTESTQRQPATLDPAEPAQFQHAHHDGDPLISLFDRFKYWRINFELVGGSFFGSSSSTESTHSTTAIDRPTEAAPHIDGARPTRDFSLAASNPEASN